MKPPIQFHSRSFTTPQRRADIDFSSGPENQSSPGNDDNEDTPEPPSRGFPSRPASSLVHFTGTKLDPKPNPLAALNHFNSSGRGEISRRSYTDARTRRVHKRRRRNVERDVRRDSRRDSDDSDTESRSRPSSREGLATPQQNGRTSEQVGLIPSIFTFIERHPNLPHILSYYAQFLLNVFIVFFMMYLVYSFWATIRSDVDIKSREVASETLAEMAACTREFKDNRCDRADRVPAMEIVCNNWEKCMQQDPSKVGRARVSAKTFAEILNSFVEPISIKTMVRLPTHLFLCTVAFSLTLNCLDYHRSAPPSSSSGASPSPTSLYLYFATRSLLPHPPSLVTMPFRRHIKRLILENNTFTRSSSNCQASRRNEVFKRRLEG